MIGKTDANTLRAGAPRIAPGWTLENMAETTSFPKTSALDVRSKAHDVDNLYIVDGSVFVTGGAVNPTPTIQAVALHIADHIRSARADLKSR